MNYPLVECFDDEDLLILCRGVFSWLGGLSQFGASYSVGGYILLFVSVGFTFFTILLALLSFCRILCEGTGPWRRCGFSWRD